MTHADVTVSVMLLRPEKLIFCMATRSFFYPAYMSAGYTDSLMERPGLQPPHLIRTWDLRQTRLNAIVADWGGGGWRGGAIRSKDTSQF